MKLASYLFIGLTPFLYLHYKKENAVFQAAILHRKVVHKSCNKEKSELSGIFLLTVICGCDMIIMLGRSEGLPVFYYAQLGGNQI